MTSSSYLKIQGFGASVFFIKFVRLLTIFSFIQFTFIDEIESLLLLETIQIEHRLKVHTIYRENTKEILQEVQR